MNGLFFNSCIKCKEITMCRQVYNKKKNKWEYWCDKCSKLIVPIRDIINIGYKRAYRKAYYQRTGR